MIHFEAQKMFNNRVSVRDCIVLKAQKRKEVVEVTIRGMEGRMRINAKTPYTTDNVPHLAQYDDEFIKKGKSYILLDYAWEPIEEHTEEQTPHGISMMLKAWKERKMRGGEQQKIW